MKGFYSPVDKLAAELPRTKGTGAEFMTELSKRPGYKPQEAQDRDLQTLMALPKMAREEFLAKLKAKPAPQLEDTTLTNTTGHTRLQQLRSTGELTKYDQWTLPGGSNYREILMRMPHDEQRAKEFADPASGHWDQPNVLAHVRAKDRTGPNGEKLLHIEEIQSDWHQKGREHGYATPESLKEFRAVELRHKLLKQKLDEAKAQSESAENSLKRKEPLFQQPDVRARYEAARVKANNDLMDLMPQVMKAQAEVQDFGHKMNSMVPNAPFKKNWHEMALKKMIHHAAENGYHGIVITPGLEQSKRYGLAKKLRSLEYSKGNDGKYHVIAIPHSGADLMGGMYDLPELERHIGKDLTKQIAENQGEAHPHNDAYKTISGQNLDIGGEGMKGFYDKMVPSFLNQFGKKYGAQVQPGSVSIVSTPAQHHGLTESQFQAQSPDEQQRMVRQHAYAHQGAKTEVPVHHFPITPEMREDVTKNGVPLYSEGGDVHSGSSTMGINVRSDKKANLQYADLIVDGHKTYESRNGDTLRPYVGKRVSIVRTGDGPAKAIGAVTVGEPMVVNRKKFREMEQHHLVPKGSAFDITNETKHLYPMHNPERYESERDVGHGIVARKVHMTKGGSIKPVGYTKEKVTVSPSLDQMQYELISVKHSKKVK